MPSLSRHACIAAFGALMSLPAVAYTAEPASAKPAAATSVTYYSLDPANWGTPWSWQAPAYPKALSEQQVTGKVDVLVNVSADGRMTEIVALRSEPTQPAFEEAVRDALGGWVFTRAMDAECKPAATQSRLQVRFEMVDGKPQVNVGVAPAAPLPGRARIEELNGPEVNRTLAESYNRNIGRSGLTGGVNAMLRVDARTGETKSVDITNVMGDSNSYNPEPTPFNNTRMPGRTAPASIKIASAAREELAALRFKPVADASQDVVTVCREAIFRRRGATRN
jgi:TonB family protein